MMKQSSNQNKKINNSITFMNIRNASPNSTYEALIPVLNPDAVDFIDPATNCLIFYILLSLTQTPPVNKSQKRKEIVLLAHLSPAWRMFMFGPIIEGLDISKKNLEPVGRFSVEILRQRLLHSAGSAILPDIQTNVFFGICNVNEYTRAFTDENGSDHGKLKLFDKQSHAEQYASRTVNQLMEYTIQRPAIMEFKVKVISRIISGDLQISGFVYKINIDDLRVPSPPPQTNDNHRGMTCF